MRDGQNHTVGRSHLGWAIGVGLLLVLALMLGVAFQFLRKPSTQFRLWQESSDLQDALASEIKNGDSLDDVIRTLGPPNHVKGDEWIRLQLEEFSDTELQNRYPDGASEADTFIAYSGYTQYVLQFRDGELINYRLGSNRTNPNNHR